MKEGFFWRLAHRRFQRKKPSILTEVAFFIWGIFFLLVYSAAFFSGWKPDGITEIIVGLGLTVTPLLIAIVHWRIRVEAAKGTDALYRKLVSVTRKAS